MSIIGLGLRGLLKKQRDTVSYQVLLAQSNFAKLCKKSLDKKAYMTCEVMYVFRIENMQTCCFKLTDCPGIVVKKALRNSSA